MNVDSIYDVMTSKQRKILALIARSGPISMAGIIWRHSDSDEVDSIGLWLLLRALVEERVVRKVDGCYSCISPERELAWLRRVDPDVLN